MWLAARISPFIISFAITCTFYINFCAWVFQCGCRALWAGADVLCNIHAAHERHCPWCSHGRMGYVLVMVLLCTPQLAVALRMRWTWIIRAIVATALFPAIGLIVALTMGWADGYWRH